MTNKELISKTLVIKMLNTVQEYELIKQKKSRLFKTVEEFCQFHKFSRQNFLKIYWRYQNNPTLESLIPQKRGPRFKTRRTDLIIEKRVIELRELGNNKYEIKEILKQEFDKLAPCPTTIYNMDY